MSILVTCECGKKGKVPDEHAGKELSCPACGNRLTVPKTSRTQQTADQLEDRNCPTCGSSLDAKALTCATCGLDVPTGKRLPTSGVSLTQDQATESMTKRPGKEGPPEPRLRVLPTIFLTTSIAAGLIILIGVSIHFVVVGGDADPERLLAHKAVYGDGPGKGGGYRDKVHGFFVVEPPGERIVEDDAVPFMELIDEDEDKRTVECSRVAFGLGSGTIRVVARRTFQDTVDDEVLNETLQLVQENFEDADIQAKRFVEIDGVRGAEVLVAVRGVQVHAVKYKKYRLDHAITLACPAADYASLSERFFAFLATYRGKNLDVGFGHSHVGSVAFSPNGERVLSATFSHPDDSSFLKDSSWGTDKDGFPFIRLWDARSQKDIFRIPDENAEREIPAKVWQPDGADAVDKSERPYWADAVDTSGQRYWAASNAVFSPDGRWIAAGVNTVVVLKDARTGKEVRDFKGHRRYITHVAFSPDSTEILSVTCGCDHKLNGDTQSPMGPMGMGGMGGYGEIVESRVPQGINGEEKIVGNGYQEERWIRLWDAEAGEEIVGAFQGFPYAGRVRNVVFSPDGRYIYCGAGDGPPIVYDLESGKSTRCLPPTAIGGWDPDHFRCFALSPDSRLMLTGGCVDNLVSLWDLHSGREIRQLTGHASTSVAVGEEAYGVASVAFSSDGRLAGSAAAEDICLWDVQTGEMLYRVGVWGGGRGLAFSPDCRSFLYFEQQLVGRERVVVSGVPLEILSKLSATKPALPAEDSAKVADLAAFRELAGEQSPGSERVGGEPLAKRAGDASIRSTVDPPTSTQEQPALDAGREEELASWRLDDYKKALRERDARFFAAVAQLTGSSSETQKNAQVLAELVPTIGSEGDHEDFGLKALNAAISALGQDGSELAKTTLQQLILGRIEMGPYDRPAAEASLRTLFDHPDPEIEAFLLKVLLYADKARPEGRGNYTARQLRDTAAALFAQAATSELRFSLAKHLAEGQVSEDVRLIAVPMLTQARPDNLVVRPSSIVIC